MLSSTLIDVVNEAMESVRDHVEQEMNLQRMVACAEVRGISRDSEGRMKCGFCYTMTVATGTAETDEKYRHFAEEHLRVKHHAILTQTRAIDESWGNSPVVVKRIERESKDFNRSYSIAVAALGGTREENTTIVDAIIHDIPEIG